MIVREHRMWLRKCKLKWLKEGDENSTFSTNGLHQERVGLTMLLSKMIKVS